MREAEILSIRNDLTGRIVSVVSVSFGTISAHIAGLWLFLREAPVSVRLPAFFLLACTLYEAAAILGSLASGAIYVSLAYRTFIYRWSGATAGPVRVAP